MGFGPGSRNFMSEEEKQNLPQVTPALLKRVFSYLAPYWKQFALTLLCIVFSSIMSLMPSILTGKIIDEGLIGRDFNKLILYIVLSLGMPEQEWPSTPLDALPYGKIHINKY